MIDDEYLNKMARLCGWKGTIVYNSMCRHVNKDQECFPSIKLMAEQHGVSRDSILKGLKILEEKKVIEINKTRSKGGQWLNNSYVLLDKTEWDYSQVAENNMVDQVDVSVTPSRSQQLDQVAHSDTKETHKQGNTYKETHTSKLSLQDEVVLIIDEFKIWNPAAKNFYGNTTERKACNDLVEAFGLDRTLQMVRSLPKINQVPYVTPAMTPWELFKNHAKMKAQLQKQQLSTKTNTNKIHGEL